MASFRKRNSLWQAQVRSRSLGSVSKSFHNKSDAVAWAKVQEAMMQTGEWKPKDQRYSTIGDLMKTYLVKATPRKKGAETETRRLNRLLKEQALMSIKLDDRRAGFEIAEQNLISLHDLDKVIYSDTSAAS